MPNVVGTPCVTYPTPPATQNRSLIFVTRTLFDTLLNDTGGTDAGFVEFPTNKSPVSLAPSFDCPKNIVFAPTFRPFHCFVGVPNENAAFIPGTTSPYITKSFPAPVYPVVAPGST